MLINSPRKKVTPINILNFERKTCIKFILYLRGVKESH